MAKPLRNLIAIVTITAVALAAPLPRIGRIAESVADLAHPILFAALTVGLLVLLRSLWPTSRFWPAVGTAMLVAVFGLVSEIVQGMLGRNASWHDFLADVCGMGAALAVLANDRDARPWNVMARRMVAVGLLVIGFGHPLTIFLDELLAGSEMPVLASFEHPWQVSRWFFHDCRAERTRQHATAGRYALRIVFEPGDWIGPSLTLPAGCRDWSRYDRLELDLFVGEDKPLPLWFKALDDEQNGKASDRYELPFVLPPGHTRFVVTTDELRRAPSERSMDLTRMKRFQLYIDKLDEPRTLYIDNLRFY